MPLWRRRRWTASRSDWQKLASNSNWCSKPSAVMTDRWRQRRPMARRWLAHWPACCNWRSRSAWRCFHRCRARLPAWTCAPWRARAASAGFELASGQLPPALGRVNPGRLAAALRGQSVSLQCAFMALLLTAELLWLERVARRLPALARLTGELAALRRHGYLEHDIAQAELVRLRKQTYDSIPYLTET